MSTKVEEAAAGYSLAAQEHGIDPFAEHTWDENHRQYFDFIKQQINATGENEKSFVRNGSPVHAAFIIAHFIENSASTVRVLVRCLKRESTLVPGLKIWSNENVILSIKKFLSQSGRHFQLLVAEDLDVNEAGYHELVQELGSTPDLQGRFDMRRPSAEDIEFAKDINYIIRDQKSIRIERNPSEDSVSARVGFGMTDFIASAIECHDALWSRSTHFDGSRQQN